MSMILEHKPGGKIPLELENIKAVELIEMVGSGSFGYVWKCADTDSGKLYALKIIQGIAPGSVDEERIRAEASVYIESPFVIPVVGFRKWDDSTWLILFEYADGKNLEEMIRSKLIPGQKKKEIFISILEGVKSCHRENIFHRDLKPSNIIVSYNFDSVKICDFGISKFKDLKITKPGDTFGTYEYMDPVLIGSAGIADARTDIYSLGHVLFFMYMGEHYFHLNNIKSIEKISSYISSRTENDFNEWIDITCFKCPFIENAGHILEKMMKIDLFERYSSVDELLWDIKKPHMERTDEGKEYDKTSETGTFNIPCLLVVSGTNKGAKTPVNIGGQGKVTLGRLAIAGADDSISREHISISKKGDRYYITDLKSKNGTFVNGTRLACHQEMEIRNGDSIGIGDSFMHFSFAGRES